MIVHMAVGENQWYDFGVGEFTTYVIFVVGWGCSLGANRGFDPWPYCLRAMFFMKALPLESEGRQGRSPLAWTCGP